MERSHRPAAHMPGLLGSAGRSIAQMPSARGHIDRLRRVDSAQAFLNYLQTVDMGLAKPATAAIYGVAGDPVTWREIRATLLRSAEQQLVERFSPSS